MERQRNDAIEALYWARALRSSTSLDLGTSSDVVSDLDIYRSAKLLVDQHGEDAASVAGLLITTEAMVAEKPKKETSAPAGGPDMGGMDF